MKQHIPRFGNSPQEHNISGLPARIAGLLTLLLIVVSAYTLTPDTDIQTRMILVLFYGIGGCAYIAIYRLRQTRSHRAIGHAYRHSVILGLGIGWLTNLIPNDIHHTVHALIFITALSLSASAERGPSYLFIAIATTLHIGITGIHQPFIVTTQV